MIIIKGTVFYTQREVATKIGVSRQTVAKYMSLGLLKATYADGRYYVTKEMVDEFKLLQKGATVIEV